MKGWIRIRNTRNEYVWLSWQQLERERAERAERERERAAASRDSAAAPPVGIWGSAPQSLTWGNASKCRPANAPYEAVALQLMSFFPQVQPASGTIPLLRPRQPNPPRKRPPKALRPRRPPLLNSSSRKERRRRRRRHYSSCSSRLFSGTTSTSGARRRWRTCILQSTVSFPPKHTLLVISLRPSFS